MDDFTRQHLDEWLTKTIHCTDVDKTRRLILDLVKEYPSLLEDRSWPEIRALAERKL